MNSRTKFFTKKILKRIVIATVCLIAILTIGFFGLVIRLLPGLNEIAQSLSSEQNQTETAAKTQLAPKENKTKENTALEAEAASASESTNDKKTVASEESKKGFQKVLVMMEEDPKDLRVCQNLGTSAFLESKNKGELKFDELMENRDDPFIEATRFPLRAIFQDEQVASLLKEISEVEKKKLSEQEQKGWLEKVGFYSRLALTAGHLYQQKETFEALGNRATHLSLLTKIAMLKPELARDANIQKFCEELQSSLANRDPVDVHEERMEMLNLIRHAGLTPEQLDFDPDQYIKLNIKQTDNEFRIELNDKEPQPEQTTL
jgi:hypothetical protein